MMHAKFLTQPSVHTIKPQCPTDVNCEASDDGDDDGAVLDDARMGKMRDENK